METREPKHFIRFCLERELTNALWAKQVCNVIKRTFI